MLSLEDITTAATIVHLTAHGHDDHAARLLQQLTDKQVGGERQFAVLEALVEVTASVPRAALCDCPDAQVIVNPFLAELVVDREGAVVLWAARFYAAIANHDLPTAYALWEALDDEDATDAFWAVVEHSAPLYHLRSKAPHTY